MQMMLPYDFKKISLHFCLKFKFFNVIVFVVTGETLLKIDQNQPTVLTLFVITEFDCSLKWNFCFDNFYPEQGMVYKPSCQAYRVSILVCDKVTRHQLHFSCDLDRKSNMSYFGTNSYLHFFIRPFKVYKTAISDISDNHIEVRCNIHD